MADDSFLIDGQSVFSGGQDASKVPYLVPNDSCSSAVNISFAQGVPSPRWGSKRKKITFPTGGVKSASGIIVPYAEIFHGGRFQCFFPYQVGEENFLVYVVSGVIYLISLQTFAAQILTVADGGLNENTPRLNWSTAGKYNVIFDYPNYPVILDGNTARRADPTKAEVPVSVLGCYNQNRLFVGNAGNEFTGGDPAGDVATPEAPVTFIEVETQGSPYFGQIFQLPTGVADGPITAMGFIQAVDTSTGIGPMFVATANSIFTFQTQTPRANWQNGQFGSSFITTSGVIGPRAFVNVNSDFFFLSSDFQVRSASMSRSEQGKWSKVPVSREVEDWLYTNDSSLAQYSVLGYFQNKVFVSTNPFRIPAHDTSRGDILDVANGGFVVLELDNQATLGKDSPPAWAGLWTPFRPMDMATTNQGQQCFVAAKDGSSNELYELLPDQTYDEDELRNIRQVTSIFDSREFDFNIAGEFQSVRLPFDNKALHSLDTGFRNIQGDFKAQVFFKPAQGVEFAKWGEIKNVAPWRTCNVPLDCFVNGFAPHQLRDQIAGYPTQNQVCDPVGKTSYSIGKKVQIRFVVEGIFWELQEYRLKAKALPNSQQITTCQKYSDDPVCAPCEVNPWAIGPFTGCPPPAIIDPCAPLASTTRFCPTDCGSD